MMSDRASRKCVSKVSGFRPGIARGRTHVVRDEWTTFARYGIESGAGSEGDRALRGRADPDARADSRDAAAHRRSDRREGRGHLRCASARGRRSDADRRSLAQTRGGSLQRGICFSGSGDALRRNAEQDRRSVPARTRARYSGRDAPRHSKSPGESAKVVSRLERAAHPRGAQSYAVRHRDDEPRTRARAWRPIWAAAPRTPRSWPARSGFRPSSVCTTSPEQLETGEEVLLDGYNGLLISIRRRKRSGITANSNPGKAQVAEQLTGLRETKSTTRDGRHIVLSANIELPDEVRAVAANGAEGIGLYRTEFLYLNRDDAADRGGTIRDLSQSRGKRRAASADHSHLRSRRRQDRRARSRLTTS